MALKKRILRGFILGVSTAASLLCAAVAGFCFCCVFGEPSSNMAIGQYLLVWFLALAGLIGFGTMSLSLAYPAKAVWAQRKVQKAKAKADAKAKASAKAKANAEAEAAWARVLRELEKIKQEEK